MPAFDICVKHPMKAGVQEPWIGTSVHSSKEQLKEEIERQKTLFYLQHPQEKN